MNNYESIPADIRSAIDNFLNLGDEQKNAMINLWSLYLRVNNEDHEDAERELENFVNELYNMPNRTQDSMLDAINEKIVDIQRELNGNTFNGGLKRRKTGKKRKRTTKKTTNKRSHKRRKRKY
jgi:DNA phosphorothioation-dependent restriction protein DptG